MTESEIPAEQEMTMHIKPRVEIDTSPPFESVKEAASLFSSGRAWIPRHVLPPEVDHSKGVYDVNKLEEHTAQLERVLINREREMLEVLRGLEEEKHLVQYLNLNVVNGVILKASPKAAQNIVLPNLDHARVNLHKTWIDLAVIRASAESLNKKMRRETDLVQSRTKRKVPVSLSESRIENKCSIPDPRSQFNFETTQFKKMVEASRYEIMKAMSEIEKTKVCIRMAELRLDAARKIEEAAKAVEAIVCAEKNLPNEGLSTNHQQQEEITLSFEEYTTLSRKAKEAEEMYNTKYLNGNGTWKPKRAVQFSETGFRKIEQKTEATLKKNSLEAVFGNEGIFHREDLHKTTYNDLTDMNQFVGTEPGTVEKKTVPVCQSTISFGDILRRKMILQDDFMLRNHAEGQDERQQVSQSEILRKQSGLIFHHTKSTTDGRKEKHYYEQKKRFSFIRVVLPKHRKKTQS